MRRWQLQCNPEAQQGQLGFRPRRSRTLPAWWRARLVKQGPGTGDFQVDPTGSVTLTGGTLDLNGENYGNSSATGAAVTVNTATSTIQNSNGTSVIFNPASITDNAGLIVNTTGDIQLPAPIRAPAVCRSKVAAP